MDVQKDSRLAIVIGNGAYEKPADLANPVNDAQALPDTMHQTPLQ